MFSLRFTAFLGGAFYNPYFVNEETEGSDLLELFLSQSEAEPERES